MRLRDYQRAAVGAVQDIFAEEQSALIVLPTGCGKTVVFAHVIAEMQAAGCGRVMVLAHREELIFQAAEKIEAVTGDRPDIEMADFRADQIMFRKAGVVVSSIQTQIAGENGAGRMTRFKPDDFGLVIIDEAHHATAASYRKVIEYYKRNPKTRILGVTATPDRADEQALGQVFGAVAYDYEIPTAITDGWLVPVLCRQVWVDSLDFSGVSTTAGDLNPGELAQIMEYEESLHGIADPLIEIAGDRKTLLFAASVAHAERLCDIINRHKQNAARWVCGTTPKEERRRLLGEFARGEAQFMVNVGVLTEGFDDPGIQVIGMGRPTKSRSLYAQMAGRGTRPLPGLVDKYGTPDERRAAILSSHKPSVEIVDFVGNSGRHKLVSAADILGGDYEEAAVDRAREIVADGDEPMDVSEALEIAAEEIEEQKARERARVAALKAKAQYRTNVADPFDVFGIEAPRQRGWDLAAPPSEKQVALLAKFGIDGSSMNKSQVSRLIGECIARSQRKQCTFKQAKLLAKYGYSTDASFKEASATIDALAKNGWRRPSQVVEAAT